MFFFSICYVFYVKLVWMLRPTGEAVFACPAGTLLQPLLLNHLTSFWNDKVLDGK